jgi:hypothetical protein
MHMKFASMIALLLSVVACTRSSGLGVKVPKDRITPYGIVRIDSSVYYLIDPNSESCTLIYQDFSVNGGDGIAAVPVDCAVLKKKLPDAGQFIKWIGAPAAPEKTTP